MGRSVVLIALPLASGDKVGGLGRLGRSGGFSVSAGAGAKESPKPSIKGPVLTAPALLSGTSHFDILFRDTSDDMGGGEAFLTESSSRFLVGVSALVPDALAGLPRRMGVMLCF